MPQHIVITISTVDEEGHISSKREISRKELIAPTDISNFGYNREEQLKIIKDTQQIVLDNQAAFLKSET